MLENLDNKEIEVATKLIFDGLTMAKGTMEMVLQSPIVLEEVDYGSADDYKALFDKECENVHLIRTDLVGEMKGISHLIFSEEEVAKIYNACLPKNVLESNSPESEMMKMGFLTEIDNMVAAAVITEFANFLNIEIYGHVPSLKIMPASDVDKYIHEEAQDFDSIIRFKANFQGTELEIAPDFIWVFQHEFMDKIRNVIKQNN
jgi:chemotaxis protein CheY-P-specific phosphatase CheC